jgi:hypothetical protein
MAFGSFVLLLTVFVASTYPEILFGTGSFVHRDFGLFAWPVMSFTRDVLADGGFPWWNPLNNYGLPFFAQWNTQVLYPGTWLALLFPLPYGLGLYALMHLVLAGAGMYCLTFYIVGQRLASGMAGLMFVFNGLTQNMLMWPNNLAAVALMPWVMWLLLRVASGPMRMCVPAILVATLQMLTGAPEMILITWIMSLVLIGVVLAHGSHREQRWQAVARLIMVAFLVAALSAVQLLPFLELLQHSSRIVDYERGHWAMPASGLANFIVPLFRTIYSPAGGFFQPGQYWTSSYYLGLGVLLLGMVAPILVRSRIVLALMGLVLIGVLLAMGGNGPLAMIFADDLPGMAWMRFPIKFVVVTTLALPLLAALAVRELANSTGELRGRRVSWLWIAWGCGIGTAAVLSCWEMASSETGGSWLSMRSAVVAALGATLLLASVLWATRHDVSYRSRTYAAFVILLVLWAFARLELGWQNPVVSYADVAMVSPKELDARLPSSVSEGRVLISLRDRRDAYYMNQRDPLAQFQDARTRLTRDTNLLERVPKGSGFFSLYLPWEREIHYRQFAGEEGVRQGIADFLGIVVVTYGLERTQWLRRQTALPIVDAGRQPVYMEGGSGLSRLIHPDFEPRREVILETGLRDSVGELLSSRARVTGIEVEPDRIAATVEVNRKAVVTVAQTHYPAWKATVDGVETPLFRANHAFQGLVVPPGTHRVELVYRDQAFILGAWVSGLAIAITAFLWWLSGRKLKVG